MAAINTETPAVAIPTAMASLLTEQVTTVVAKATVSAINTRTKATAADTATLTPTQILSGYIQATPTAAASYTLPTAALLVAAMRSTKTPAVGDSIVVEIVNISAGAFTITVLTATGATAKGTVMTIAQNKIGRIFIDVTNVTAASEAYDYTVASFA
jgi:hypothetical protein